MLSPKMAPAAAAPITKRSADQDRLAGQRNAGAFQHHQRENCGIAIGREKRFRQRRIDDVHATGPLTSRPIVAPRLTNRAT